MRRTFDHLTDKTFVQLYKSLIRPMLEYGHSVWSPDQKTLQREVEDVQKRATKLISRLKDKPYHQRLQELKLPSLQFRRLRGDMIDTFKYTSGIYDTNHPELEPYTGREVRSHSKKLAKKQVKLKVRSSYFAERIVSSWNSLPETVVSAPSVNSFKSRLDKHWAKHPLLFNPDCYNWPGIFPPLRQSVKNILQRWTDPLKSDLNIETSINQSIWLDLD